VVTSTNVADALSSWTSIQTNIFGTGGTFSNAVPILPAEPKRFFMIKLP
jgi:hypothetical protein